MVDRFLSERATTLELDPAMRAPEIRDYQRDPEIRTNTNLFRFKRGLNVTMHYAGAMRDTVQLIITSTGSQLSLAIPYFLTRHPKDTSPLDH